MFIIYSQHALLSSTITNAPSIAGEEEGSDESQSALTFSCISLTAHQQNDLPRPATARENMKNTDVVCLATVTAALGKANEPNEPRPHEDDQETVSSPPPSQPTVSPHSKCTCCLLCVVWAKDEAQRTPSMVCVCMEARDND